MLFRPILAGATPRDRLLACGGALGGIGLMAAILRSMPGAPADLPMMIAPIGASAVLLFAVPASPLAQPWPIIGGNVVSAIVGMIVAHWLADSWLAAGVAVGAAILVMSLLRCLHPPGGAVALSAVIAAPSVLMPAYYFPLVPVAVNSFALVLLGWLFHRFSGHSYPHRATIAGNAVTLADLVAEDIDRALIDLGETFDVSREDLDLLLRRAEQHAIERRARLASPRLAAVREDRSSAGALEDAA